VAVNSISQGLEQLQDKTPLSIIVFSQNKAFVDMVRRKTRSGALLQNDLMLHHNVSVLPFGGVGESGALNYIAD
jgi:aldehyde dehydrogenase (NAD+)